VAIDEALGDALQAGVRPGRAGRGGEGRGFSPGSRRDR
jgi:hypothetical protein